jgi:predicted esterase
MWGARRIFSILVPPLFNASALFAFAAGTFIVGDTFAGGGTFSAGEVIAPGGSLNPPVSFIETAPIIDGLLDPDLSTLPERRFTATTAPTPGDAPPASFRMAYGPDFLYVFVGCEADSLIFRDRAFQNGDGFHMVIAAPHADDSPTDEFYVIACSAVNRPEMQWSRRVIWYYNVDHLFQKLGRDARLEFAARDGRIGFELLLPWQDISPYHPWFSDGIGFNIRFVKAIGRTDRIEYILVQDPHIDSEQHLRLYARLSFAPPTPVDGCRSYAVLDRNHIAQGDPLGVRIATAAPASCKEEDVVATIKSGEGTRVASGSARYLCEPETITRDMIDLDTRDLPPGGYRIEWSSRVNGSRGETGLTIMPALDFPARQGRLDQIAGKISAGSATTIRYQLAEIEKRMAAVRPYETCADERIAIARTLDLLERADAGKDALAGRTGFFRRAFRSRVDGTLQPYGIRVPAGFDRGRRYPLIVYLHGSGSDETDLESRTSLSPPGRGCIEICPRARGTSNAYTTEGAQEDIAEAIEDVMANYPIDSSRVVLTGFSMGGYGVYRTFFETPKKFGALAVFSGHPDIGNRYTGREDQPAFLEERYLLPFNGVPIFIFHGRQDRNCPYELTEELVTKLRKAGAKVEFRTEANAGHQMPGAETTAAYHAWLGTMLDAPPALQR